MAIRLRHQGDDPEEVWLQCENCEGTGKASYPVDDDEVLYEESGCGECEGLGFYEGDFGDFSETVWTD